ILFGSEPESYFNHYAPKHVNNSVGVIPHEEDKSSFRPPTTIPMSPTADIDIPTPVHYNEKVQALHAYEANPEDPSELSFAKGEIMDIMDRNGNWWQARKSDGSVGIIPSNYVSDPV
ncbi:SH3 domain-containing protein, partial [Pilobolus umbonatus]